MAKIAFFRNYHRHCSGKIGLKMTGYVLDLDKKTIKCMKCKVETSYDAD